MRERFWFTCLALAAAPDAAAQYPAALQPGAPAPTTAAAAAQVVRTHYFSQDFSGGVETGRALLSRFPGNAELRAWYVVNMARLTGREREALAVVDSASLWPASQPVWRDFARSFAMSYQSNGHDQAIATARRVRRAFRWSPDAVWLHAYVLHRAGKYDDVVALADSAMRARAPWGELLVLKANALVSQANSAQPGDTAKRRRASEAFAQARRIEPSNLNAHWLHAANLAGGPTDTVTFALLKRAVAMTPALGVHERFWREIRARRDLTPPQKDSIVAGDVARLLAMRPRNAGVLRAAHDAYVDMKRVAAADTLLARLRAEHPNTVELDWAEYGRLQVLRDSASNNPQDSAAIMTRWRAAVEQWVTRPTHAHDGIYGTILLWHWHNGLEEDTVVSADSLKRFAEALIRYNTANPHRTHVDVPLRVAERKGDFRWAERLIVQGDSIRRARYEERKQQIVADEGVGYYADLLDASKATMHSGLGWIYIHEGRLADAERELNKALELNRKDPRIHYHFGRLAEARGQPVEAQAAYARGFPLEQFWTGYRNRDALRRMYAANHGGMDGFDAYVERLREEDRQRRRTRIASERKTDGVELASFRLERYGDNETVTNDALKGRIAVVNFWGVWCGPCVKEIPDIQKFHEAVKDDSAVVFLTVDYNDAPETLDEFMKKRKLTFPVLLDTDRWVSDRAQVSAFPTTLFIGRDGRIAWKHVGASDLVLEEFLWRVEMLKREPAVP